MKCNVAVGVIGRVTWEMFVLAGSLVLVVNGEE